MAQWIRRPPTERKIPGSIPGVEALPFGSHIFCVLATFPFVYWQLSLLCIRLIIDALQSTKHLQNAKHLGCILCLFSYRLEGKESTAKSFINEHRSSLWNQNAESTGGSQWQKVFWIKPVEPEC